MMAQLGVGKRDSHWPWNLPAAATNVYMDFTYSILADYPH